MSKRIAPLNTDRQLQAYVIGLAIGDGNVSNPNGRAVRLRITCDKKHPELIVKISSSLKGYFSVIKSASWEVQATTSTCIYSNHLEGLLGWKASGGSKAEQVAVMMREIGFRPHLYRTRQCPERESFKNQVRLSREVPSFLALVSPLKA
jgi:hypothetical protein